MLRKALTRFVQKVELLCVAGAPGAEAAVQAKPQPRRSVGAPALPEFLASISLNSLLGGSGVRFTF
jgi:hypothetical protein